MMCLCFSAPAQGRGWLLVSFHFHVNNALPDKVVLIYPCPFIVEEVDKHKVSGFVGTFNSSNDNAHPLAMALRGCVVIVLCDLVIGLHFDISGPMKTAVLEPVNFNIFRWPAFVVPFHNQLFCNVLKRSEGRRVG